MRNLLISFISIIIISNLLGISSAKRIKRNVNDGRNHTNISDDFVVLNAGTKKNLENRVMKSTSEKDNKSFYDAALVALTTKSANDLESMKYHGNNEQNTDDFRSIKKQSIVGPLAYVLRNRDQNPVESNNGTQRVSSKLPADKAESRKSLEHLKDRQNILRNKSEVKRVLPSLGQETANIVGAHVIMPPRYLMSPHAFYPFAPIDQMLGFANAMFHKVGMDDDSAENGSPVEFNSIDSPLSHVVFGRTPYALARISSDHEGRKESLTYSKPSNSKESLVDRKSIDLLDLIENVFNNPNKDQVIHDEIEIYCPLHNGKGKTTQGNCHKNSQPDDIYKGDVLEVCSCHLVNKDKDESPKNHK